MHWKLQEIQEATVWSIWVPTKALGVLASDWQLWAEIHGHSSETYYMACFQVSPSRLLTAAAILNTRDVNQKPFTAFAMDELRDAKEYCKQVAVTAEKKVAIVDRLSKFIAPCFWAKRIAGTPVGMLRIKKITLWRGLTNFDEHRKRWRDIVDVFTHFRRQVMYVSLNRWKAKLA